MRFGARHGGVPPRVTARRCRAWAADGALYVWFPSGLPTVPVRPGRVAVVAVTHAEASERAVVQWDCRETSGTAVLPVSQGGQGSGGPPAVLAAESIRLLIATVRKLLESTKSCDGTGPDRGPTYCRDGAGGRASVADGRPPNLRMRLHQATEQEGLRAEPDHGAPERRPLAEADAPARGSKPFALRTTRLARATPDVKSRRIACVESVRRHPQCSDGQPGAHVTAPKQGEAYVSCVDASRREPLAAVLPEPPLLWR